MFKYCIVSTEEVKKWKARLDKNSLLRSSWQNCTIVQVVKNSFVSNTNFDFIFFEVFEAFYWLNFYFSIFGFNMAYICKKHSVFFCAFSVAKVVRSQSFKFQVLKIKFLKVLSHDFYSDLVEIVCSFYNYYFQNIFFHLFSFFK